MSKESNSDFIEGQAVWSLVASQVEELFGFAIAAIFGLGRVIKVNWLAFVIATAICVGLAHKMAGRNVERFRSEMVVNNNQEPRRIFGVQIDTLNKLVAAQRYAEVAKQLGIPLEQAEKILAFDSLNIYRAPLIHDSTPKGPPFYVIVDTKESFDLKDIESGVVRYLNNTPYQKRVSALAQENSAKDLQFWEKRVSEIDSVLNQLSTDTNQSLASAKAKGMASLLKELRMAKKEVNQLRNILSFYISNAELRMGFTPDVKISGRAKKVYYIVGIAAALAFTIMWSIIRNVVPKNCGN
jgi:hypothetical protein